MSSNEIQVISRLFDFLGAYSADELTAAAGSPLVTMNVRDALLALARARAETTGPIQIPLEATPANGTPRALKMLEEQLYAILTDNASAPSTPDLARALSRTSIRVQVSSKDGRSRIISRLRRELDKLSPKEREQKYRQLLRELRPNQTEGWFKVIRGDS